MSCVFCEKWIAAMGLLMILQPLQWSLSIFGVCAAALICMLAAPLRQPPALAWVEEGATAIGADNRPQLSRFQARDGTWLAYRLYPARGGAVERLAILVHGSSASSEAMHAVARALAESGVAAAAIDARGHGASGTRGDIGYLGQLDDDLADMIGALRQSYADAQLTLIGHSSGGGFALRIAGEPLGKAFSRFILLAPYLGYAAPTSRPQEGAIGWARADVPRIIALSLLGRIGIDWPQSMPVIAFAVAPEAAPFVTPRYSYRLLANFAAPEDWRSAFAASSAPIDVIAGDKDELMYVDQYSAALKSFAGATTVCLVTGVDHMGVVYQPAALAAIVAAVKQ
jgi:alpha-beta hydrolase superfamily lysophospholipase